MTAFRATCDVVVVGAGVAGVSAAAELAAACSVVLVEQEMQPAFHASGRSASILSETSGHPLVCELAQRSRPFFEHPPLGFVDFPLLSPRGLLWVGERHDQSILDALAESTSPWAPTSRRLSPAEVLDLLPTFAPAAIAGGGVFEPDACSIDAALLIDGYLTQLRVRGGTVLTSTEAIALTPVSDHWIVQAGGHSIHTGAVVNAAGAWADVVAERAGVAPIGLTALKRTAAVARTGAAVGDWPLVMDVAARYYCEPVAGGILISPADEQPTAPGDARADEADVAFALERVAAASGLPLRAVLRAWAGLRTFAPDRAPVMGEDPTAPGFWWLAGQGGGGIKTAPALAALLTKQIVSGTNNAGSINEESIIAALSPARFRDSAVC